MPHLPRSAKPRAARPRLRPGPPPPRRRSGQVWLLGLGVLLLIGTGLYWQRRTQANRYVRRAWATLTGRGQSGLERTPLLDGYTVHGIDVSAYQGRIDWKEVARHRVQFAFIKASEGATRQDPRFARNWQEARAAGIVCGAYHYYVPTRDAGLQANLFARTVPRLSGALPPVLDVEANSFHDVAVMRREVARWLLLTEAHYGVRPIIYSNHGFYRRYLAGHFDDYPLWLAHYEVAQPTLPASQWIIWQHSDEAYVPGIRGTVDFNVYQGNYASLLALRVK